MLLRETGNRRPLLFRNGVGERLTGMLYEPEIGNRHRVPVVIPVNSIKYRIGSFRFHHSLATELVARGFPVLTFDPHGIGDSEGSIPYQPVGSIFAAIQKGLHVDDTRRALDTLQTELACDHFLLIGLCGGAVTSALTMQADSRVERAVLLGMPMLFDRSPADASSGGDSEQTSPLASDRSARLFLATKLRQLGDREIWRRILRGDVDLRGEAVLAAQAMARFTKNRLSSRLRIAAERATVMSLRDPFSAHLRYNLGLQSALMDSWSRGQRTLFVYGSLDPLTGIFEDEFLGPARRRFPWVQEFLDYRVLAEANHIFSGSQSQRELSAIILDWVAGALTGPRNALAESKPNLMNRFETAG